MCKLNIQSWPECHHMRTTSSEACFYALSRPGMAPEECPNPQHNFIEEQPAWPCPKCTMDAIDDVRTQGHEDEFHLQYATPGATTDVLDNIYAASPSVLERCETPITIRSGGGSTPTQDQDVNVGGNSEPGDHGCMHSQSCCRVCNPDQSTYGTPSSGFNLDTPNWVDKYVNQHEQLHALDLSDEESSVATSADLETRLKRYLER